MGRRDAPARRGAGQREHGQPVRVAARHPAVRVPAAGRLRDAGASADRRRSPLPRWPPRCRRRSRTCRWSAAATATCRSSCRTRRRRTCATGACTFVGVGRATLPQPDFVRQLQEHGRLDRKRVCRTFSYCTALMRAKHNELGQFATGCPPFDKEVYGPDLAGMPAARSEEGLKRRARRDQPASSPRRSRTEVTFLRHAQAAATPPARSHTAGSGTGFGLRPLSATELAV